MGSATRLASPSASARRRQTRQRWLFLLVCAALVALHAAVIAQRRVHPGDFDVSREFGRRFLAGEMLYAGGLHYPYMPAAAMYFSPLAVLPPGLGLALRYAVALACLGLTLRLLFALVRERHPALAQKRAVVALLALALAAHYLVRDLDDGGPHVILLAVTVAGVYWAARRREARAALCLGLAAALKATALLWLPFLLWKRQWRLFALTALAAAAWIALPALWMGRSSWWLHQSVWAQYALASSLGAPLAGALESEERLQNEALRTVVARWFDRAAAAALVDTASSPAFARLGGRRNVWGLVAMAALVAVFAWRTRGPTASSWLVDASGLLILTVLLSPVAWVQHLVVALPALYLIAAEDRAVRRLGPWWLAVMGLYVVLALMLNREVLGRDVYLAALGAGIHTAAMLLLLVVVLFRRPAEA